MILKALKTQILLKKRGYDAGKKISGIKRHIAVDTQGLPHAIYGTTAEATDRSSAVKMVENAKENFSEVENILVDASYTGGNFAIQIKAIIGTTVEVIQPSELHTFAVLPKRWVVESSFPWLEKCRRLWKNCERKLNTSLQMIVLSFISLLLRRF